MIRRRIFWAFLPALLLVLAAGGFAWLLHSEAGARWLLRQVAEAVPGQLQYRETHGDLQSGLRLVGLNYRQEGLSVEGDRIGLRLSIDFLPPAVSVHDLEFGQLVLRTAGGRETGEPANPGEWLPLLGIPVPVELERIRGDRLLWFGEAPEPALDLRRLSFAASWFRGLELREARARLGESDWTADLAFDFDPPHALALNLQGAVRVPGDVDAVTLAFFARGSGDLERSRWELQSADPSIVISGELSDLLRVPRWDLQLAAERLPWPLGAAEPSLVLQGLSASSYGTPAGFGLEAEARLDGPGIPPTHLSVVGAGDPSGLEFERLDAAGDAVAFSGAGRLDWQSAPAASATLVVSRFNPAFWMESWGDAAPLSGSLQLSWTGEQLGFELGGLTAPGTLAAAAGSGSLDLAAGTVAANLDWQAFAWPPGAAEPVLASSEGEATLGGRLDAWTVDGELSLSGPDFPPGRLQLRGGGDRESLSFAVPQGAVLGGRLAGQVDVRWSPEVSWAVTADVEGLATAPLAPDFPGRLSGSLAVRGRPQPPTLEIDIRELSGVVRARPVQAHGQLVLESGRVVARGLRVRSGRSELALDGHQGSSGGLDFRAEIDSLADLLDDASGSLSFNGSISVDATRPHLRLDGAGRDVAWGDTAVASLTVVSDPGGAIRLQGEGLEQGERRIDRVSAVADGQRPLERLEVRAESGGRAFEMRLEGAVQDWSDPLGGGWAGMVRALRLHGEGPEFVELEEQVGVALNSSAISLDNACFRGSVAGRMCLAATWRPRGESALEVSLEDISPNLAMTLLDSQLSFSQRISGRLDWRQVSGAKPSARLDLRISEGEVTALGEEEPLLATGAGLFGFELADGRLYGGTLDIPVPGAGGIHTDFNAPDVSAGLDSPVQGRISVNFNSIEPFLRLLPGIEGSSGPLTAELDFSGTLADPELTGHASLVRGSISHDASGLSLEEIRLAGAVYRYDQTELSGTFRAGSGQGSIRAVLNFSNLLEPEMLLQVHGEDLAVVSVPGLNLTATPDVRLVWRDGTLNLDGKVAVPSAGLSPLFLPVSAASESADVVIVSGHDPLAETQATETRTWQLRGSLELELGDNVRLTLDRAKAQLSGSTRFTWDGPALPTADGGFTLGGEILAYGQLLKVADGRINFSNRPADNPFLNIRAEREIFGNSQVRRAGVLVTGTLKEPLVEPYSVPMTTRERALALLVTGSDFDYEQGVGSVEVGMYVAPRLFISYGIGLFEDQNVISARYDLGRGFGLKTTSGQRESGADISYTIER